MGLFGRVSKAVDFSAAATTEYGTEGSDGNRGDEVAARVEVLALVLTASQ